MIDIATRNAPPRVATLNHRCQSLLERAARDFRVPGDYQT
jgi:hypothetical protein